MFSDDAARKIHALTFDPQAERLISFLPLGSIFWRDELPQLQFLAFAEGADRDLMLRLFSIRIQYWNTNTMTSENQLIWREAQQRFPDWAFFRRLNLTVEDKQAHEEAQRSSEEIWIELFSAADESTVIEKDGLTSYSLTFNVDGDYEKPD